MKHIDLTPNVTRQVRIVFIDDILNDVNQTVSFRVVSYYLETWCDSPKSKTVYRSFHPTDPPLNGETQKCSLLDLAARFGAEADLFSAADLIEWMSRGLVVPF